MRKLIFFFLLLFLIGSFAHAVVNGKQMADSVVQKTLGVRIDTHLSQDTPEIPIGPRVAITCGHCVGHNPFHQGFFGQEEESAEILYHPKKDVGAHDTNALYENLTAGEYGLSFLKDANYSYDLALVIVPEDEAFEPPYVSVSNLPIQEKEVLVFLGSGKNTSTKDHYCNGYASGNKYFTSNFEAISRYNSDAGVILSGVDKKVATCYGDSGGYYFRVNPENKTLELAGINSWGTEDGITEVKPDGKAHIAGFFSGANDLANKEIQSWLKEVSESRKLEICGINKTCDPIKWPRQ